MLFCFKLFYPWPHHLSYPVIQNLIAFKLVNHSLPFPPLTLEFNAAETWVSLVVSRGPQQVAFCPLFIILTLFISHFPSQSISVGKKKKGMKLQPEIQAEIQPVRHRCGLISKHHRENRKDLLLIHALMCSIGCPHERPFWTTIVASQRLSDPPLSTSSDLCVYPLLTLQQPPGQFAMP